MKRSIFQAKLHALSLATALAISGSLSAADNVITEGGSKNIKDLIGINTHDGIVRTNRPLNNSNRITGLNKMKPATFRYVGGEVASYMNVETGKAFKGGPTVSGNVIIDTDIAHEPWIVDIAQNHFGNSHPVSDFKDAADQIGFKGMFLLNMITPGADYFGTANPGPLTQTWWNQLDNRLNRNLTYLQNAQNQGMNVKYIELGNEFFFYGTYRELTFPTTGWSYRNAANDWAHVLKNEYPNSEIALVGSFRDSSDRERRWNERIVDPADWSKIDAVTLHVYMDGPYGSINNLSNEINNNGYNSAMGKYLKKIRNDFNSMKSSSGTQQYIYDKGRTVWYTEWNVDNLRPDIDDTWANTLATCYLASLLLDNGKPGKLLIQSDKELTTGTGNRDLTAIGKAYSIWGKAARGATQLKKLRFQSNPSLVNSNGVLSYMGYKFTGNGTRYVLVNFSSQSVAINTQTAEFNVKGKTMIRYKYPNNLTTTGNGPTYTNATIGNRLWLDKHSVILIQ